jgi:pteridine reductase
LGASRRRVDLPSIVRSILAPDRNRIKQSLSASVRQTAVDQSPLRRIGPPADVDRLILYLLEGTQLLTVARFRVDGGRFLGVDS